jgi:ketopantoate reductase
VPEIDPGAHRLALHGRVGRPLMWTVAELLRYPRVSRQLFVQDVAPQMRALFGPRTMVVTMQNGIPWWYFHKLAGVYQGRQVTSVDPQGIVAANIEVERVIGSVVYPATELMEPGVVRLIEGNRFTLG